MNSSFIIPRRLLLMSACASFGAVAVAGSIAETMTPPLEMKMPNALAVDALANLTTPGHNTLFSPLGLSSAIDLTRSGLAAGDDEAEASAMPPPEALSAKGVVLAGALWLDTGVEATQSALRGLNASWGLAPTTLDLGTDGPEAINGWVAEATEGRIPQLLETVSDQTSLIVTTAMVFQDVWSAPFDASLTSDIPFSLHDGTHVELPAMQSTVRFDVWQTEAGIVSVVPFAQGLQMMLHLPAEMEDDSTVTFPVDVTGTWFSDANKEQRPIVLPKLSLSATRDLSEMVRDLELDGAIQEGLNTLTEIPQSLGPVLQAVTLEMDETGAEVTAATAIVATRSLPSIPENPIVFDRPFDLYIFDPATGSAVLAAHVADPRG